MDFKRLAPVLLALGLSAPAKAASAPYKLPTTLGNTFPVIMPGVSIIPLSLPTVDAEIVRPVRVPTFIDAPIPMSLPSPVPVNGRIILPGVPSPLPLPTAIAVVAVRPPRPAAAFNALNETRDSAIGREPIRMNAGDVFDGRRESARTDAKFF